MGGYSSQRVSNYYHRTVYGQWKLPTSFAGSYPSSGWNYNISPEMFFGFFPDAYGLDIGLFATANNTWKLFANISSCYIYGSESPWHEGNEFNLAAGNLLYVKAYISKVNNNQYKCNIRVSRNSYDGSDLMSGYWSVNLNSSFAQGYNVGCRINREIALARNVNAVPLVGSGCYVIGAKFLAHGLESVDGTTYIWSDDNSMEHNRDGSEYWCLPENAARKIILMRNDDGALDRTKVSCVTTNPSSGATETTNLDFQ